MIVHHHDKQQQLTNLDIQTYMYLGCSFLFFIHSFFIFLFVFLLSTFTFVLIIVVFFFLFAFFISFFFRCVSCRCSCSFTCNFRGIIILSCCLFVGLRGLFLSWITFSLVFLLLFGNWLGILLRLFLSRWFVYLSRFFMLLVLFWYFGLSLFLSRLLLFVMSWNFFFWLFFSRRSNSFFIFWFTFIPSNVLLNSHCIFFL